MSENYESELYQAVDDIFYDRPKDYTNQYPLLALDDDLDTLRKYILPTFDQKSIEHAHESLYKEILEISMSAHVQTRGRGFYYLEGQGQAPRRYYELSDSFQLSGRIERMQIIDIPSFDSFLMGDDADIEVTPCIVLKDTTLHLLDTSRSLSEFSVHIPVNSSKLGLDRVLDFDETT